MRISTPLIRDNILLRLQANAERLFRVQDQLSSGKRLLTPRRCPPRRQPSGSAAFGPGGNGALCSGGGSCARRPQPARQHAGPHRRGGAFGA